MTIKPSVPSFAAVLAAVAGMTLAEAAAAYASTGLAVFPAVPDAKRPMTRHGFRDASSDPATVAAWWRRWPNANIGLPTSQPNGFDVLDIDVHPSGSGFAALARARRAGLVEGWSHLVRTPSGGSHLYFRTAAEPGSGSWSVPAAHVDFRGVGGYVIVPPSRVMTASGQRGYRLVSTATATAGGPRPLDAARLRRLLAPPVRPRPPGGGVPGGSAQRLAAWLAGQPEGNRNRALFWAACRQAEAGVAEADIRQALGPAAARSGLDEREITATLASAHRIAARRHTGDEPAPASGRSPR